MANKFQWTKQNFETIVLGKRKTARKEDAAKSRTKLMTIQGEGRDMEVKNKAGDFVASANGTGEILKKRIYNLYYNSEVAMSNPQNIADYKAAKAAEKAGESDKAHELFGKVANSFQVSFGILHNDGKNAKLMDLLGDNVEISAKLQLITTEKGSIITIDPTSIRVMEPEVDEAGTTLPSSFLDDEDEEETVDADAALAEA